MARLYVANLSLQIHEFIYREPETNRQLQQTIRVGQQVQIGGEAAPEVLSAIVGQHERYGIVAVSALTRRWDFAGLCYQFDKPIAVDAIVAGLAENKRRMEEQGAERRKVASVAAGAQVRQSLYDEGLGQVRGFSVEVEEVSATDLKGADREAFDRGKMHETHQVDLVN